MPPGIDNFFLFYCYRKSHFSLIVFIVATRLDSTVFILVFPIFSFFYSKALERHLN